MTGSRGCGGGGAHPGEKGGGKPDTPAPLSWAYKASSSRPVRHGLPFIVSSVSSDTARGVARLPLANHWGAACALSTPRSNVGIGLSGWALEPASCLLADACLAAPHRSP